MNSLYQPVQRPLVNFINILRARFSYKSELSSFSLITVIVGAKISCKNARVKRKWNWLLLTGHLQPAKSLNVAREHS